MESVVFTTFVEMKRGLNLDPSPLILHTPKPCTTSRHFTLGQKSFSCMYPQGRDRLRKRVENESIQCLDGLEMEMKSHFVTENHRFCSHL